VADGPYVSCSTEQICLAKSQGIDVDYRVDNQSSAYFENWFVQMDLMCKNPFMIGLILSVYLLALGISGMSFAWIPDYCGRKKTVLISFGFSLLFQLLAIFINNFYFRMACFACMGACCIKNGTSYAWLFEMVESRHKPIVCSIVNAFDTMTLFFVGFYVIFISRHWLPLYAFYTVIGGVSWLVLFFVPESPQWYLQSGQKDKAIEAFNKIARINNSTEQIPLDANFKECKEEQGDTVSMRSFIPSVAGMSVSSFVL
jgi:MFS family permease